MYTKCLINGSYTEDGTEAEPSSGQDLSLTLLAPQRYPNPAGVICFDT